MVRRCRRPGQRWSEECGKGGIPCYEGASALWFLEHVLTDPTASLVCESSWSSRHLVRETVRSQRGLTVRTGGSNMSSTEAHVPSGR